jgi:transposase
LAQWFHAQTADGRSSTRKTMIVALARKLLTALKRLATMVKYRMASFYVRHRNQQTGRTAITDLAALARSADDDPR